MEKTKNKYGFLKYVIGAFIVLAFTLALALNYAKYNRVYAAKTVAAGEVCDGFSFTTSTNDLTYDSSAKTISASATGKAAGTCSSASSGSETLTIKNTYPQAGTISFSYSITGSSGGTIKINNNTYTGSGNFSLDVPSNSSFQITITTAAGAYTNTITLSNISSLYDINADITFLAATDGGKYTVSYGDESFEVLSTVTRNINASNIITFTSTPNSGKKLFYWSINGEQNYVLTGSFTTSFTSATTIQPVFCDSNAPIFTNKNENAYYQSLSEANTAAKNASGANNKIIIPVSTTTTIPAGDYEISNGVTLLLPFDATNTVYTSTPTVVYGSHSTPTAYKTLNVPSNTTITVKNGGAICVSSKLCATGTGNGSWNGTPTGPGGRIMMNENSNIILESGANLYCWGYISGTKNSSTGMCAGQIIAQSGSVVYEAFQIRSWRGGTATSGMNNNSNKVFPIPMYYVQNIECELKIYYGAREELYTSVNASSSAYPTSASFIGTSTGIFRFASSSSSSDYIIKRYNYLNDQLEVIAHANISLSSITISISVLKADSSKYILPINDVSIRITNGYTVSLGQSVAFIPDSKIIIDEGGVLDVTGGNSIYVYDSDDWSTFAADGKKVVPVGYSVANGTTAKRTDTNLKDAEIIINGLLQVSGGLYTTSGGADIHSEITYNNSNPNNGVIKFNNAPGTATNTYMATQSGTSITYVSISITSAKLKNGTAYAGTDGEFFETSTAGSGARFVFQVQYDEDYNPLTFAYNKWGVYSAIIFHTLTYTDGTNHYNIQFREGGSYTFDAYPNPDDPTASIYTLNNDYKIKGWIVEYNYVEYFFMLGSTENNMSFTSDIIATAFYGGYINDGDAVYYVDKGSETYESGLVKGLYRTLTQDGTSLEILYFDLTDGHLITNPDNNIVNFDGYYDNATYYIDNNGYVKNLNLYREVTVNGAEDYDVSYYYFDDNNQALKSGTYYINTSDSDLNINCDDLAAVLPSGYYEFDEDGKIIGANGTGVYNSPTIGSYVDFDGTNFTLDGIKIAAGLVDISDDVYYIQEDGTAVKSKTVYVTKFYNTSSTYGIGLYYFGSDGKLIAYKEVS